MIKKIIRQCKYCGKNKEPCKAHIIPKCFYPDYANKKYRILNPNTLQYKICQSGIWDDAILCSDCDNLLGKYDSEAYRVFLSSNLETYKLAEGPELKGYLIPGTGYNYKYLRYFFISLLWRASISNKQEFSDVKLGKYENIALKILKNEINNETLFRVIILKEPPNKIFGDVLFVAPFKYCNKLAYKFFYAGYLFNIIPTLKDKRNKRNFNGERVFINEKELLIIESEDVYLTKKTYVDRFYQK